MQKPTIDVNFNSVIICGQEVKRPYHFSVKDWFLFWETADAFDMEELVKCRVEIKSLRNEMEHMKFTIDDLKDQAGEIK